MTFRESWRYVAQHYLLTSLIGKKRGASSILLRTVSLGGLDSALRLLAELSPKQRRNIILCVSSSDEYYQLKAANTDVFYCYQPFGSLMHSYIFIQCLNINKAAIMEGGLSPCLLAVMQALNREVILLNGRMTDNQRVLLSYALFRALMLDPIKLLYVQTETLKNHLERWLNPDSIKKVPSYALPMNYESRYWPDARHSYTPRSRDFITLANFHICELAVVKTFLTELIKLGHPLLLVPRFLHDCDHFVKELRRLFPEDCDVILDYIDESTVKARITVIKNLSVLGKIYSDSAICIVGGSFSEELTGHDLLTPAFAGSVVFYGPYISSQESMHDIIKPLFKSNVYTPNDIIGQIKHMGESDIFDMQQNFLLAIIKARIKLTTHFRDISAWIDGS